MSVIPLHVVMRAHETLARTLKTLAGRCSSKLRKGVIEGNRRGQVLVLDGPRTVLQK